MDFAAHISELCARMQVTRITVSAIEQSYSKSGERVIGTLADIGDELTYYVALHELGHIARGHRGRGSADIFNGTSRATLRKEGQAWLWAFEHAECKLPPAAARRGLEFLHSYLKYFDGAERPAEFNQAEAALVAAANPAHPDQMSLFNPYDAAAY